MPEKIKGNDAKKNDEMSLIFAPYTHRKEEVFQGYVWMPDEIRSLIDQLCEELQLTNDQVFRNTLLREISEYLFDKLDYMRSNFYYANRGAQPRPERDKKRILNILGIKEETLDKYMDSPKSPELIKELLSQIWDTAYDFWKKDEPNREKDMAIQKKRREMRLSHREVRQLEIINRTSAKIDGFIEAFLGETDVNKFVDKMYLPVFIDQILNYYRSRGKQRLQEMK
jgi:hypothetical protein